jgi:hypothetical protein
MRRLQIASLGAIVLTALAASAAPVMAAELGRGSGTTVTKAAYTWRIALADEAIPCVTRTLPACHNTSLTVENTSAQPMACVGQLRFTISGEKEISWTENAGLTVDPGAAVPMVVSEFPDKVDLERSFVVCWTTAERDEADTGDAPFARAAPAECKVQLVSSPGLEEYFPTASQTAGEGGLVSVRIALPLAQGTPKVLGVNATSGLLRIDRGALLVASKMTFKTNCPGTQRLLPIRFQLKE